MADLYIGGKPYNEDDSNVLGDQIIGGAIRSATGGLSIIPASGPVTIGDAGTPGTVSANDDLFVSGASEFDGTANFHGTLSAASSITMGSSQLLFSNAVVAGVIQLRNAAQSVNCMVLAPGSSCNYLMICQQGDIAADFGNAQRTDPTTIHQSSDATEVTERSYNSWNEQTIGGGKGSYCGLKSIIEEVTIAVGQGAAGVDTSGNLAPATSRIRQVMTRVTQAPGGGATTLDVGRKNGGNLDEYADGTAVALNTTTIADDDGDGNTDIPHWQTAADVLTLTTDVNVAASDMKVRVVVFYEECTVPAS
jgi:hypothetical protein